MGTETASETRDLYRSDNVVVRQVAAGDRDRWVVTFDNYGIGHGFSRPGFGESWLRSQKISAIHVMGRAEDWYQYEDLDAALAIVRATLEGASRVITYGSSMGGYAAVRFADAVGAHAALALSPQYTLDPEVAAHDRRWSQDANRIAWIKALNGPLEVKARVILAFDPWGLDGWHGRRIVEEAAPNCIRLPYTAHPVTTFLSEIGLLGDLVLRALHDVLDVDAFEREARSRKAQSGVYLGEMASLQPEHRRGLALALARRAVEASPANHHARLNLARLLLRNGAHDEALALFEGLVADSGRALTYLVDHGQALAVAGRPGEARAIAAEVIGQADNVAHLHGWAAHMCWLNGDTADARTHILRAVELDPSNSAYMKAAVDYHLGRRAAGATSSVRQTPLLSFARWLGRRAFVRNAAKALMRRTPAQAATAAP
ncbi:tetratricopeptide repeat protein [Brevundimonas staleyi]|uniref:Tetratricopeptide repeat protein n=1 Tax=Brevundimonas staleyi TaxID=74326 RepID=A0ABW0FRK9_9CAUL